MVEAYNFLRLISVIIGFQSSKRRKRPTTTVDFPFTMEARKGLAEGNSVVVIMLLRRVFLIAARWHNGQYILNNLHSSDQTGLNRKIPFSGIDSTIYDFFSV